MKIKLLVSMAGNDFTLAYGDVIEWPDVEAQRLIETGDAICAEPPAMPKVETPEAKTEPVEDAEAPVVEKPKRKRRSKKNK